MTIFSLLGLASIVTGFLSGLVGLGGGIIMAPILIFCPGLIGLAPLSMKTIAGLTIVQGLVGCLCGGLFHHKFNVVSGRLLVHMGIPVFVMSFLGGYLSGYVSNSLLLIIFASLAFAAAILILIPVKGDSEAPDVVNLKFKSVHAVTASASIGLLGGMVGQGGSFILIPLMTAYVKIPTRIAIGSNLAIVALATTAGFLGKAAAGQIAWLYTLPILLATPPSTYIGSRVSRAVSYIWLKRILALLIGAAAVKIWVSILLP